MHTAAASGLLILNKWIRLKSLVCMQVTLGENSWIYSLSLSYLLSYLLFPTTTSDSTEEFSITERWYKSCDSRRIFSWGWSNLACKCLDGCSKHCFKALLTWGLQEVIIACWQEDEAALRRLWDVSVFSLGAGSRLESVGEDDELMVENGESSYEIAVKYSRGGRKHSLPQQLESAGARQVGAKPEGKHGQDGKRWPPTESFLPALHAVVRLWSGCHEMQLQRSEHLRKKNPTSLNSIGWAFYW